MHVQHALRIWNAYPPSFVRDRTMKQAMAAGTQKRHVGELRASRPRRREEGHDALQKLHPAFL